MEVNSSERAARCIRAADRQPPQPGSRCGESPSFNYFRNFADPVSALLCQRKWDLQQRPSTATAAFGSHKQLCTPHLLKKLSALNNLAATLPLPFSALLVLTQRGLPGSEGSELSRRPPTSSPPRPGLVLAADLAAAEAEPPLCESASRGHSTTECHANDGKQRGKDEGAHGATRPILPSPPSHFSERLQRVVQDNFKTTTLPSKGSKQRDVVVVARPWPRPLRSLAAGRRPVPRQNRHHFGPVVISSQEIQNGVDAAVDARQRPGDLVREVDDVEELAVQIQHAGGVVERPGDVKRDEAHGEHHQHHDDELDGLLARGGALLAGGQPPSGSAQGPRHQAVAHHDDQERDAEQEHHDHGAVVHASWLVVSWHRVSLSRLEVVTKMRLGTRHTLTTAHTVPHTRWAWRGFTVVSALMGWQMPR
ncbi:hypothetical protein EYF80_038968 [Liparis tanakae]|uniref:Uncharacterized protein n=1 Tax=Liparis tanakae TaxID=230148 RepID=A0A4Z2GC54_9TELE|nr:hypothetical protein EYF80_038968 [Liparis tanakae]